MKTERRHELQENELANWLGEKLATLRPYGKAILGVLVLALVALIIVNYLRGRGERMREAGWSAYFEAMTGANPEAFEEISQVYPGTDAAGWAMQRAADLHLDEALRQMFQDREAAKEEIDAARDLYEKILAASSDPMLQQRATYGLAKCLESQGDFTEAAKQYEQIASRWSDSAFAELAQQRLQQIQQPGTRQWYNWFAEQKPVSSPLTEPGMLDGLPELPEGPDLKMPAPGQLVPGSTSGAIPGAAIVPELGVDLPDAIANPTDEPLDVNLPREGAAPSAADQPRELDADLPAETSGEQPAAADSGLGVPSIESETPQGVDLDFNSPDADPSSP
jgi:hypothetical protein